MGKVQSKPHRLSSDIVEAAITIEMREARKVAIGRMILQHLEDGHVSDAEREEQRRLAWELVTDTQVSTEAARLLDTAHLVEGIALDMREAVQVLYLGAGFAPDHNLRALRRQHEEIGRARGIQRRSRPGYETEAA